MELLTKRAKSLEPLTAHYAAEQKYFFLNDTGHASNTSVSEIELVETT